jgi:hypothetical protein
MQRFVVVAVCSFVLGRTSLVWAADHEPFVSIVDEPCECDARGEAPRVQLHLSRVASMLAARDTSGLTASQRVARQRSLLRLQEYAAAGRFPRNEGYSTERIPVFVDAHHTRCAVGELIADSGRLDLVEMVVERSNLSRVPDIDVPELAAWAEAHGFTLDELTLIQPSYCSDCPEDRHEECRYTRCEYTPSKGGERVHGNLPDGYTCRVGGGSGRCDDGHCVPSSCAMQSGPTRSSAPRWIFASCLLLAALHFRIRARRRYCP